MRVVKDRPETYKKIWYWAHPDADKFPHYNVHGPQVYMDRQVEVEDWKFPGEEVGLKHWHGNLSAVPPGRKGCEIGRPEWFGPDGAPFGVSRAEASAGHPASCQCPDFAVYGVQAVLPIEWLPFVPTVTLQWPTELEILVVLYSWRPGNSGNSPLIPPGAIPLTEQVWAPEIDQRITGFTLEGPAPGPVATLSGNGTVGVGVAFWANKSRPGTSHVGHNINLAAGTDQITLAGFPVAWPGNGEVLALTARIMTGPLPVIEGYLGPFHLGAVPSFGLYYPVAGPMGPTVPSKLVKDIPLDGTVDRIGSIRVLVSGPPL